MKKSIYKLTYLSILLAAYNISGQAPNIEWKNFLNDYIGHANCGDTTADKGYIVGGDYASHFLVVKLDASGTKQWDRWITSGTGITTVSSIKQTTDGGYIAAGSDFGGADSIGNHGIRDFMVTKLDSSGNVVWMKAYGGTSNEEATSIAQTADGGYIVAGYTGSNDGNLAGNPVPWYTEFWVVKLDASGNIVWQKAMGGSNYDYATSVIPTADGGYAVTGYSQSKDKDVTGTHWGGSDPDVWVVKLDASGNIVWQKSYGGSKEDHGNSIKQTSDGGYIIAGYTTSNDGNVTGIHNSSNGTKDYWIIKIDATGNLIWQKCLGGSGDDVAYSVVQTVDGGYAVAGTAASTTAVNGDISGYHGGSGSDYWVVKLDTSGNITWQKAMGGKGSEDARTIVQSSDGGYIIAGTTIGSPDGDVVAPGFSYGDNHLWVVKLETSGLNVRETDINSSFSIFPNPAKGSATIANLPSGSIIKIFDMTGRTVFNITAKNNQEKIDTSNLANGVYVVQVTNKKSVINRKLIINK